MRVNQPSREEVEIDQLTKENAELRRELEQVKEDRNRQGMIARSEAFKISDELRRERDELRAKLELDEAKVKRLEGALDRLLIHSVEFYNDWKKGDFDLPRLAQHDMNSMVAQFPDAQKILNDTEEK